MNIFLSSAIFFGYIILVLLNCITHNIYSDITAILYIILFIRSTVIYIIKLLIINKNITNIEKSNKKILFILDEQHFSKYNLVTKIYGKNIISKIVDFDTTPISVFNNWIKTVYQEKCKEIDIVIDTYGGDVTICDTIFSILRNYSQTYGKINTYIPTQAYSAGALIALTGDRIFMNKYARLGPIDTQHCMENGDDGEETISSATYVKALQYIKQKEEIIDVDNFLEICELEKMHSDNLHDLMSITKNKKVINAFGKGIYPHYKSFDVNTLKKFGLKIHTYIPKQIQNIYDNITGLSFELFDFCN